MLTSILGEYAAGEGLVVVLNKVRLGFHQIHLIPSDEVIHNPALLIVLVNDIQKRGLAISAGAGV